MVVISVTVVVAVMVEVLVVVAVAVILVFADVVVMGVASAVAKAVARDVKVIRGGGICSEGGNVVGECRGGNCGGYGGGKGCNWDIW
jgi:hypothetical protein